MLNLNLNDAAFSCQMTTFLRCDISHRKNVTGFAQKKKRDCAYAALPECSTTTGIVPGTGYLINMPNDLVEIVDTMT